MENELGGFIRLTVYWFTAYVPSKRNIAVALAFKYGKFLHTPRYSYGTFGSKSEPTCEQ